MTQKTKMASSRARKYSLDLSRYYRKPSTQVSLSIVLSFFIVAFFLLVAIKPTLVTITKLKLEIEESETTLVKLTAKVESLTQAARVWETIQPALPYVKTSIPQEGVEYNKLTKSIEILAQESGVEITSMTLGESLLYSQILEVYAGKNQEVVEMPITIRVVGSFPQTLGFMESVLKLDRLMGVESVTVNREVKGIDASVVGMAINGNVQYLANTKMLNKAINPEGK